MKKFRTKSTTDAEAAPVPGCRLEVEIRSQTMRLLRGGEILKTYPISTSKFGPGTEPDSFRTPTGKFQIAEKIGRDLPAFAELKGRLPTGEVAAPGGEEDKILTRILWLDGMEPDNANTRDRYIYIHGTNQEALLGTPASHGCVRMSNEDVRELFEQVTPGTPVEILV